MKVRFIRCIFIFVVAMLIIAAVYNIFYKGRANTIIDQDINNSVLSTNYKDKLIIGVTNFDTINPVVTTNKEVINISKLIFEPLISLDENYKIIPCIAKECAKLNDTSYLIKIDETIKWQDGTNLTPEDVEFTIGKIKEINSIYSDNVVNIKEVEIIDKNSIKINLNNADSFFEYKLVFPIIKKDNYTDNNQIVSEKNLVGTGMYRISEINENKILLKENKYYRNLNKDLKIRRIEISKYENMEQIYEEFKIGNIDIFNTSNIYYRENIGTINYKAKEYDGRDTDFLVLNLNRASLAEKDVRKALNAAINKENIVQKVYNAKYKVITSPTNYGGYEVNNENEIKCDKEYAKLLLQSSGYLLQGGLLQKKFANGNKESLSFNLVVNESDIKRVQVAEMIQNDLKEVGIQINLIKVKNNIYLEYLQNKNYDIILTGINNGVNTEYNYFYGENNIENYSNTNIKEIIYQIGNTKDDKKLKENYSKLNTFIAEELPYIGLYRNKCFFVISSKISGDFNPNNYFLFYNIETWRKF